MVNNIIAYAGAFLGSCIIGFALSHDYMILSMGGFIIMLLAIFRVMAMVARRLHDFNVRGVIAAAFFAFNFIFGDYEFANLCSLFINILIFIWPGNKFDNQYGEVPKSGISY